MVQQNWNLKCKKGKKREEVGGYTMCHRHLENEECPVWCVVQHSKQSTAAPIYIYIKPKNLAEKVVTCDASCRHCRLLCPPHFSHLFKKQKFNSKKIFATFYYNYDRTV